MYIVFVVRSKKLEVQCKRISSLFCSGYEERYKSRLLLLIVRDLILYIILHCCLHTISILHISATLQNAARRRWSL